MKGSCYKHQTDNVDFSTLAAEIFIYLPQVSETIVNAAIYRATVEFLSTSRVYRDSIEVDFERYTDSYPIEPPDCTKVLSIDEVWFDSCEITDYKINVDGWVVLPKRVMNYCDGTDFLVKVSLGLSQGSCTMPRNIYERYGDGIKNMTLSYLYGMFGEEWYDINTAKFYGGIGRQSMGDAKSEVLHEEVGDSIPIIGTRLIL